MGCGLPAGLPKLGIRYKDHDINGAASSFKKKTDKFLQGRPDVSFEKSIGTCCLVYLDPDAPERNGDGALVGHMGPYLHWLVSECEGGKAGGGREHLTHMGPMPPKGRHRYIFVLFKQEGGVKFPKGLERKKWDFPAFLAANKGVLTPAAANFFYCSSD